MMSPVVSAMFLLQGGTFGGTVATLAEGKRQELNVLIPPPTD